MVDKYTVGVHIETQPGVDFWRLSKWVETETRRLLSQGRRIRSFDGLSVATDDRRTYKRPTIDQIEAVMADHHAVPRSLTDFVPSEARGTDDLFAYIHLHYNPYADVHDLKVSFTGRNRLAVQRIAAKFYEVARGLALEQMAPGASIVLGDVEVSSHDEPTTTSRFERMRTMVSGLSTATKAVLVPILVIVVAAIVLGVLRSCGVPVAV